MDKKVKLIVDYENQHQEIECDGMAGVTCVKEDDGHTNQVMLVGNLSVRDLVMLHKAIEEHLLTTIKQEIHDCSPKALGELLAHLL